MKPWILVLVAALLVRSAAVAQAPAWQWVAASGGAGDTSVLYSTAADAAGNVVVAGLMSVTGSGVSTFGTTTLTPLGRGVEAFVAKLAPTGQWLWAVPVSSPGDSPDEGIKLFGVGVDAVGNIYVGGDYDDTLMLGPSVLLPVSANPVGSGSQNVFIGSLTSQGQWRWGLACDPATTRRASISGLATDAAGHVTVTGQYHNAITFGAAASLTTTNSGQQGFVARASSAGQWEWAVAANSASAPYDEVQGAASAVDGAGNAYVMGYFRGTLPLGATTLVTASPDQALFVAKLSATGQWLWAAQADASGAASYVGGFSVAAAATGEVYIGGTFAGSLTLGTVPVVGSGAFLAALSAQGQWVWGRATATGGGFTDFCWGLAVEPATGDVLAAGSVSGPTSFDVATPVGLNGQHLYVARFSAAGAGRWAIGGGDDRATATSLALGPGARCTSGAGSTAAQQRCSGRWRWRRYRVSTASWHASTNPWDWEQTQLRRPV